MMGRIRQLGEWERDGRAVALERGTFALVLLGLFTAVLALRAVSAFLPAIVVAPPVVLVLTFVPGTLFLLALGYQIGFDARSFVYALGCSLVLLMSVGLVANVSLPLVGYDRPLSVVPIAIGSWSLVAGLTWFVLARGGPGQVTVPATTLLSPVPLSLSLLPLASVLAITVWNRVGRNEPLLVVLTVLAFLPLLLVCSVDERWYAFGLWAMGLAGLHHTSLFKYNGFSGNPAAVWSWSEQIWSPGIGEVDATSSELLQNGVLFPMYATLADVQILTQYDVVNPFLIAFVPVAMFVAFRSFVPARTALLGAAVFVVAHPFYIQYPYGGRAATPVLFLALLGVVLSDRGSTSVQPRHVLGLVFGTGIVVSHYGTSFFVMFALIAALVLLVVYDQYDEHVRTRLARSATWPALLRPGEPDADGADTDSSDGLLNWTFVGWYSALAIAWYLYLAGGRKFKVLPNHTYRSIQQIVSSRQSTGRSAARVQRDYGSEVIDFSRRFYFVLAGTMGIGLLFAYYSRFLGDRGRFVSDPYLAFTTMLLGFFGVTFVVRTWGGGRPMMIAFTFTAIFSIVGIAVIAGLGRSALDRRGLPRASSIDQASLEARSVLWTFGILLSVLFLLNTGVVSATLVAGEAPSDVPSTEESNYHEDIALHVWLVEHQGGPNVVGDSIANGQTDWYRPQIVGLSDPPADYGATKPRGDLAVLSTETSGDATSLEYGYLLMTSVNVQEEAVSRQTGFEPVPVASFDPGLDEHSKIYTTGTNEIYYRPSPSSDE